MFNVLPDNLKQEIKKQYGARRFVVILNFIIFIQIFTLIAFFPSWVTSFYNQKEAASVVAESEDALLIEEVEELSSQIQSINKKLEIIKKTQTGFSPTQTLDSIIEQKSPSILINEFTFNKSTNNQVTITLTGSAGERESLLTFIKKLESSKLFDKVDSPISNFTKDRNISFSLFLTMKISNEK
ncbi:MAG: hypothetical protein V4690_02555 [Patescibacteria group bacterium]